MEELVYVVRPQRALVAEATLKDLAEGGLRLYPGDHRAHSRREDTADHHTGEETGPGDSTPEVVGVHRDDAPYSLRQIGCGGQGEHRPHGLTDQRHVLEVEFAKDW